MAIYRLGQNISVLASFHKGGVLYDPTEVTLTVIPPRYHQMSPADPADVGTPAKVQIDQTSPLMYHDAVGEFVYDLTFTARGTWRLLWLGTATYLDSHSRNREFSQPVSQRLRCYI